MSLHVGDKAPDFTLPSHLDKEITLSDLRGKNVVLVFFPMAWTPVWTNQIPSYEADLAKFAGFNAQVLGISIDHVPCLKAWAQSLGGISYPLLSDFWPHGRVAEKYGVLRHHEGRSERAIFIIDTQGIIRYIDIHDIDEQPDNEVLWAELRQITPGAPPPEPEEAKQEALPHGGVVMYCTSWCPDCRRARMWLRERGVEWVEVDVNANPAAAAQVRKWTNGSLVTPTFDVNGTIVVDFRPDKLAEALG
jgi:peroxiredoxin/glutaredoxin